MEPGCRRRRKLHRSPIKIDAPGRNAIPWNAAVRPWGREQQRASNSPISSYPSATILIGPWRFTFEAIACARLRPAGKEIHSLDIQIFGQLGFGRRALVAIEALDDFTVDKADVLNQLVKLRLRQSAADSGGPEVGVAARRKRELALHYDICEVEPPPRFQHPVDLAKRLNFIGR